jgi:hypothetical protein
MVRMMKESYYILFREDYDIDLAIENTHTKAEDRCIAIASRGGEIQWVIHGRSLGFNPVDIVKSWKLEEN